MDLIVLGSAGSYPSPTSPCSGYIVRSGSTNLWLDCGNGTFGNLQKHLAVQDIDAIVITHEHPDHFVDIYGLHVLMRYGLELSGLPVFAPPGGEHLFGHLVNEWGDTFEWHEIDDGAQTKVGDLALRFSRTDHPPPTFAVEISADDRRLVYTADTGPDWTVGAFEPGADLVLSEATYLHAHRKAKLHLSAQQAGEAAREARADRLMLTHLWPRIDPVVSVEEGSEAFGRAVTLAAPHLVTRV
jgi:ribonuclease BN (tRNA processing enzyme)